MNDYREYCDNAGISTSRLIQTVRARYPSFSKVQLSMANTPEKYALCLIPEAEKLLEATYGRFPGLRIAAPGESVTRSKENRTKPNRLVVRLGDEQYRAIRELMDKLGFSTVQDFLCTLLVEYIAKEAGG